MIRFMRYIILHGSAGSFLVPACLPIELSNFLTIRPFNSKIHKLSEAEGDGNAGDGNSVNAEIRGIIKRLDDEKVSHRKIAKVVKLDGRKYPIYQQVCREMGIAIERDA